MKTTTINDLYDAHLCEKEYENEEEMNAKVGSDFGNEIEIVDVPTQEADRLKGKVQRGGDLKEPCALQGREETPAVGEKHLAIVVRFEYAKERASVDGECEVCVKRHVD